VLFRYFIYLFLIFKLGNYLVLNNASVHIGSELWDLMITIFEIADIYLYFLSIYLPELNVDEFILHLVKNEVKQKRFQHEYLWLYTITALAKIIKEIMWDFTERLSSVGLRILFKTINKIL
jgi:hypothetical protein